MRILIVITLLTSPVSAWEAKSRTICTLSHSEPGAEVVVTYDPTVSIYAISVSGNVAWIDAPVFGLTFNGKSPLTITTNRQMLDGRAVTVTDRGFGNVLNGLQFNTTATATLGAQSVTVSLEGAAPEVDAFRACTLAPTA